MSPVYLAVLITLFRFLYFEVCYIQQGPALYAFNNAVFTSEDWVGIRMLHDSVKVDDPMKVGRFGLGFKSVFHMTGNSFVAHL